MGAVDHARLSFRVLTFINKMSIPPDDRSLVVDLACNDDCWFDPLPHEKLKKIYSSPELTFLVMYGRHLRC